jgi:hypothetical protein
MLLSHHRVEPLSPLPVMVAELAVAVAVRLFLPVLNPQ